MVVDHRPIRVQAVIAGGGADKEAGKCVRGEHIFNGAILDDEVVITKELHPASLDAGEVFLGLEVDEGFVIREDLYFLDSFQVTSPLLDAVHNCN